MMRMICRFKRKEENENAIAVKTEVFISHRRSDESVADMIKDFLVATGIPNEKVFFSLPGNDVNERIEDEIKEHLHNAAVILTILSRGYYKSAYCLNEAGIAWYLDDVLTIPICLPEIDFDSMVGFLNSNRKLRRLNNEDDISYVYDQIHERIESSKTTHSIVTRETKKLIDKYEQYIQKREIVNDDIETAISQVDSNSSDTSSCPKIKKHSIVMLFFAAEDNGEIIVTTTLSGTSYVSGKNPLNSSNAPRELSKWESTVEELLRFDYIKCVNEEDRIYHVTDKGYITSDILKNNYGLDAGMSPSDVLALLN